MRIIERERIEQAIDLDTARDEIARAHRLYSAKKVTMPAVAHLGFDEPPGDCHIKAAHLHGEAVFAVKVSNGFYRNPSRGLPSSNGLVLVFSAETGVPLALLDDRGLMTDVRTALAGTIATSLARPDGPGAVGIVGAGTQARLQLAYLNRFQGPFRAFVWSRSTEEIAPYVRELQGQGIEVEACDDLRRLCAECNTLITTTPATAPLIHDGWVEAGTHITAVGADAEGKQELDPALFGRARGILVDSRRQCIDHAEVCHAIRAGITDAASLVEIGEALEGRVWQTNPAGDITIADLSGLGASDAMMAQLVWNALKD